MILEDSGNSLLTSSPGEVLGIGGVGVGVWGALREVERERSDGSGRGRVVVTTGDWFQDSLPDSPQPDTKIQECVSLLYKMVQDSWPSLGR